MNIYKKFKNIRFSNCVVKIHSALVSFSGVAAMLLSLFFTLFVGLSSKIFAANFTINTESRISALISKAGVNRITMLPHRILQVTGDKSKYKIESDEDGGNVYIMPLVNVDEEIEISIKASGDLVQDMLLQVKNIKGQSIKLHQDNDAEYSSGFSMDEAKLMMKNMRDQEIGKYYVLDENRPIKINTNTKTNTKTKTKLAKLDLKQIKTYRWGNITGAVLELINETRCPVSIDKYALSNLYRNIKIIAIEGDRELVPARTKIKSYFITVNENSN